MTLGRPIIVLNRLFALLATVFVLLSAPINEGTFDPAHSHESSVIDQAVTKSAPHAASCHGATFCNLIFSQFEGAGLNQLAIKDASKFPIEAVVRANRTDEFDTPPPRTVFL